MDWIPSTSRNCKKISLYRTSYDDLSSCMQMSTVWTWICKAICVAFKRDKGRCACARNRRIDWRFHKTSVSKKSLSTRGKTGCIAYSVASLCVAPCPVNGLTTSGLISRPFVGAVRSGTRVHPTFLAPMMTGSCRILKDPPCRFLFFLFFSFKWPTLLTLNPFGGYVLQAAGVPRGWECP